MCCLGVSDRAALGDKASARSSCQPIARHPRSEAPAGGPSLSVHQSGLTRPSSVLQPGSAKAVCCLLLCDGTLKTCRRLNPSKDRAAGPASPRHAPSLTRARSQGRQHDTRGAANRRLVCAKGNLSSGRSGWRASVLAATSGGRHSYCIASPTLSIHAPSRSADSRPRGARASNGGGGGPSVEGSRVPAKR